MALDRQAGALKKDRTIGGCSTEAARIGRSRIIQSQQIQRDEAVEARAINGNVATGTSGAACATNDDRSLGDGQTRLGICAGQRERIITDLGQEEGPGNRTREGDVAAGRPTGDSVDVARTDARSRAKRQGATDGRGR